MGCAISAEDKRWKKSPIVYDYHSSITDGMKTEIEKAIDILEREIKIKFRKRNRESSDYIRFRRIVNSSPNGSCGNSGLGYIEGSVMDVNIKEDACNEGHVMHELGHRFGLIHEHQRPDRAAFIEVDTSNSNYNDNHEIRSLNEVALFGTNYDLGSIMHYRDSNVINVIRNPNNLEVGQRDYPSTTDIEILKCIMHSNVHLHKIEGDGKVGSLINEYFWRNGWTTAEFYKVGSSDYLFILRQSDGIVHIYKVNWDGTIGDRIQASNWTAGWTTVRFYKVGLSDYVFLLKKSNGTVRIHKVNGDGTIGELLEEHNWSNGWSVAEFYKVGFSDYLFMLKESDGTVHIHKINGDGKVGDRIETFDWTSGWTTAKFYKVGWSDFLFLLKKTSGTVHIHQVNGNGTIGSRLQTLDWTSGWSSVEFYKSGLSDLFLGVKASDGTMHVNAVNNDSMIGSRIQTKNWTNGWTNARIYEVANTKYLFLLKETRTV